jgi:hypothetical protein
VGSPRGRVLVLPRVAGAQQGLRGGGLEGRVSWWGVGLARSWGPEWLMGRDPGGRGSSMGLRHGAAKRRVSRWHVDLCGPRGGDPAVHGSGTGLWPGAAGGVESPAEWSSGSGSLQDWDLAGRLFFY